MKRDQAGQILKPTNCRSACRKTDKIAVKILVRMAVVLPALIALGSIPYFILGPARGFFHADCTDTIYWAEAAVESGRLLNPDFGYAALLPFGANLWLIPLVRLFGMSYGTHSAGMLIFVLVYGAAALFLATQLRLSGIWRGILVTGMLLLLSGSAKLREIMWGHVIYYSLGILFLMIGLALIVRYDTGRKPRRTLLLLAMLTAGVATNGAQSIALYLLPLAGAVALERFFTTGASWRDFQTQKAIRLVALMAGMTLTGLVLLYFLTAKGTITAGYANGYSTFSSADEWCANAAKIIPNLLSLYGITAQKGVSLASLDAIIVLVRLSGLIVLLAVPALLMAVYRQISCKALKYMLWAHHITAAIILFLVTLGSLGNANWRLTPLLGTAALTTVIGLSWVLGGRGIPDNDVAAQTQTCRTARGRLPQKPDGMRHLTATPRKRLAALCLIVLLLNALINAGQIYALPVDNGQDNTLHQLTDFLLEHELEYGYATFWQAQAITLLSNQKVSVRNVAVDQSGISPRLYQSNKNWYQDQQETNEYFLLLDQTEYDLLLRSPDWPSLEHLVQDTLEAPAGYSIVILSQNPWALLEK
jgi:hypothetical protein